MVRILSQWKWSFNSFKDYFAMHWYNLILIIQFLSGTLVWQKKKKDKEMYGSLEIDFVYS